MKFAKILFLVICMSALAAACGSSGNQNPSACGGAGVPVAPNNALITANVLEVTTSPSNETILRLYITQSENVGTDINMAQANTEIEAVAQNQVLNIQANDTITASASLLGDECGQVWMVTNITKL
jgi:hypothetical protein